LFSKRLGNDEETKEREESIRRVAITGQKFCTLTRIQIKGKTLHEETEFFLRNADPLNDCMFRL